LDSPLKGDAPLRGERNLQLAFTVEDEGVFTPWSATITYGPGFNLAGRCQMVGSCLRRQHFIPEGKGEAVSHADKPDF
jgi:hypothetical protein